MKLENRRWGSSGVQYQIPVTQHSLDLNDDSRAYFFFFFFAESYA